ncbi:MAG TPA: DUF6086 family protein [Candidatus Limnocylindrales bacterium]
MKHLSLVLLKWPQTSVGRLSPPCQTGRTFGISIASRLSTCDPFDDAQLFADQPDLGRLLPADFTVDAALGILPVEVLLKVADGVPDFVEHEPELVEVSGQTAQCRNQNPLQIFVASLDRRLDSLTRRTDLAQHHRDLRPQLGRPCLIGCQLHVDLSDQFSDGLGHGDFAMRAGASQAIYGTSNHIGQQVAAHGAQNTDPGSNDSPRAHSSRHHRGKRTGTQNHHQRTVRCGSQTSLAGHGGANARLHLADLPIHSLLPGSRSAVEQARHAELGRSRRPLLQARCPVHHSSETASFRSSSTVLARRAGCRRQRPHWSPSTNPTRPAIHDHACVVFCRRRARYLRRTGEVCDHGRVSQYFRAGDRILWNPSNRAAELFIHMADVAARIAERPTGIRDEHADEYEVDPAQFEAFVDALTRRYLSSSHPVVRTLLEGFIATALVLVDRAGGTVSALSEVPVLDQRDVPVGTRGIGRLGDAARLLDLAATLARVMPR